MFRDIRFVKPREIVCVFDEQVGFFLLPFLQGLNRGLMVQRPLRDVVVVERYVTLQGGFKFGCGGKSRLLSHLGNASIKALDHPVSLGVSGRREALFDSQRHAFLVKEVFARHRLFLARKSISELVSERKPIQGCYDKGFIHFS